MAKQTWTSFINQKISNAALSIAIHRVEGTIVGKRDEVESAASMKD